METIHFQCGGCGKPLAVEKAHLGQQVYCPHCEQVVVAPSPDGAPDSAEPTLTFAPPEEHESIFAVPSAADDLFGHADGPLVEMPTEPLDLPPPGPVEQETAAPAPALFPMLELHSDPSPPDASAPPPETTLTFAPAPATSAYTTESGTALLDQPAPATPPALAPAEEPAGQDPIEELARMTAPARPRGRGGWYIALFIIPLISYAILATLAAFIFWQRWDTLRKEQIHPLEYLPDLDGDHPTKRTTGAAIPPEWTRKELPEHLLVALGETLRLGELEVEPLRIERGSIVVRDGPKGEPVNMGDGLKLYLRLKNCSEDLPFYPMDRYFTRYWRPAGRDRSRRDDFRHPPFTQLVIGDKRFYGGPAGWDYPSSRDNYLNEYVIDQDYERRLAPGEELTTFVCTDPTDPDLTKALAAHDGPLLWRVQVRRGSVPVKGRRVPATAVLGVKFDKSEIKSGKKKG